MQEITCAECATTVLVEKFSPSHTSVQWLDDAARECPRIARHVAVGEHPSSVPTCPALRDSIERSARSGRLATDSHRTEPARAHLITTYGRTRS
jgi:hypothetical protein